MNVTREPQRPTDVTPSIPPRLAYSVDEVGQLLGGLARQSIYKLLNAGDLRSFRVNGRRLIAHEDLAAYIDRQRESD